jgi:hypothetical protein
VINGDLEGKEELNLNVWDLCESHSNVFTIQSLQNKNTLDEDENSR